MADGAPPMRPIGEIAETLDALRRPVKASQRLPGPYPYYGAQGIVDFVRGFLFDGEFVLVAEDGENLRSRKEKIALMARGKFWVNNHAHILRGGKEADTRYLYYAINAADISGYVTGSTIPKLSQGSLNRLFIPCPHVRDQRAIVSILAALDDKIDLNRQINETLEAMARAIFKDWFVDFGPTRAKMEGRAPYLAPEIWKLFPDRLDDKGSPDGWLTIPIKSTCSRIVNGGTPRRDIANYWNDGTIPWLTSGEVRKPYLIATANFITEAGLAESSAKWVDPDATVVALYGATAGQVSFVATKMTTNQAVCSLTALPSYRYFNYLVLSSLTQTLAGMATGSAQQNLSKGLVEELPILAGDLCTMKKFDSILEPFFKRIVANEKESTTLAATRDLLLPKLMSGELRVRDAEKIAETVL